MRADKFFAEKFGSRTKAAEAIEKGWVLLNGKPIKPKDEVKDADEITFVIAEETFVSNGGYKLARALKTFPVPLGDKVAVDIGASTGGFTDCLLQNGIERVYAVDVGESQLAESIALDERVVVMDNTNARYLKKNDFPERIDVAVTDVSFISLRLILPALQAILDDGGFAFVLIKPQFECEKKNIGKSGIVHPSAHADIVKKLLTFCTQIGLYPHGIVNAPVRKGKNIEYVLYLKKSVGKETSETIVERVKQLVKLNSLGELV
ncbi:MAG: TlyA family RNA methyltransferase [Clostridia bacterium]|nr:TlyA family RNA methyltransferase [Clostridia bacterium]